MLWRLLLTSQSTTTLSEQTGKSHPMFPIGSCNLRTPKLLRWWFLHHHPACRAVADWLASGLRHRCTFTSGTALLPWGPPRMVGIEWVWLLGLTWGARCGARREGLAVAEGRLVSRAAGAPGADGHDLSWRSRRLLLLGGPHWGGGAGISFWSLGQKWAKTTAKLSL